MTDQKQPAFIAIPLRLLAMIWASPYTLLGLLLGMAPCTGGRARIRGRVVEFYGGGVKWFFALLATRAIHARVHLGHTVLGQTDAALDVSRDHEMVHVRQFERWGPLMGPAYLGCSHGIVVDAPQALPRQSVRAGGVRARRREMKIGMILRTAGV